MRATYMSLRKGALDPLCDPLARVIPTCVRSGRARGGRGARGTVAGGAAGSAGGGGAGGVVV